MGRFKTRLITASLFLLLDLWQDARAADGANVVWNGGIYLYSYLPFIKGRNSAVEIYPVWFNLDSSIPTNVFQGIGEQSIGVYVSPRYSDSRLKPPPNGNFWVEEAYGYYANPWGKFKLGKTYSRFGRYLETSYYGTLQLFDGLKLEQNYGASLEVPLPLKDYGFIVGGAAQFFVVDGLTDYALPDRDTVWIPNARKRNMYVGRLEPSYRFDDQRIVTLGVSAQHFTSDIPGTAQSGPVNRYGLDLAYTHGPLKLFLEHVRQFGWTTNQFPFPNGGSNDNRYILAGGKIVLWDHLIPQYHFTYADYHSQNVSEYIHQPGLEWVVQKNLSINAIFGYWKRSVGGTDILIDRSILAGLLGTY